MSFARLTARQREVLALIARGLDNKEIAYRLSISVFTVQNHVQDLLKVLGAKNRTEAAILYWRISNNGPERTEDS